MKNIFYILLLFACKAHAQQPYFKTFTPSGSRVVTFPSPVTGTTETTIFQDTILANNFTPGKDYSIDANFYATNSTINASNVTLRLYVGGTVITVLNGVSVSVSLANATPFYVNMDIKAKTTSTEYYNAQISSSSVAVPSITIPIANATLRQSLSESMTSDMIIKLTVQIGGVGAGSTTIGCDAIQRDF